MYDNVYQLNQKVVYQGKEYFVFAIRCAPISHPEFEVEYLLSIEQCRPSTTNSADTTWIIEHQIMLPNVYHERKIAEYTEYLKTQGLTVSKL